MGTYVTNTGLMATYGGQFTLTIIAILFYEIFIVIKELNIAAVHSG
ncbi:hypothetical protein SD22575_0467 [Shigella dysenteriae 225-75]|nr:hypothetical protein SD22575_0467 [Shigella dysenteriae 225-75]